MHHSDARIGLCRTRLFSLGGLGVALLGGVFTGIAVGQDPGSALRQDPGVAKAGPWRIGFGYSHMLNVPVRFRGLGGLPPALPLPPGGSPGFGEYDDGFVRADISGETSLTSNWGYTSDSQYDPADGGSIALSATRGIPGGGERRSTENAPGFEFSALRELGRLENRGRAVPWGLSGRFHVARFDIEDRGAVSLDARRITDRFRLDGVIPPLAPYNGSFTGPGALLSTDAVRSETVIPGGFSSQGFRGLEADLISASLGAWIEWPLSERFSFQLEGGFTLAVADGTYTHRSEVTAPGGAPRSTEATGSRTSVLPGFHAGLTASYALSERWSVLVSGRFQYLDDFAIRAGASTAELSFGKSFILGAGVRFQF